MFCSVCGNRVPEGRTQCQACGSRVSLPAGPSSFDLATVTRAPGLSGAYVGTCPNCGFQGPSMSFFSRGWNVAVLAGSAIVTGFVGGLGGVAYFLLRHQHRICPRCKEDWGKQGIRAVALQGYPSRPGPLPAPMGMPGMGLPSTEAGTGYVASAGRGRRGLSIALFLFAALMMVIGIAEFEVAMMVISGFSAAGGWLSYRSAESARERRREALLVGLQQQVLRLAPQHRGVLTVTQVAASLGWPMHRAEKVLNSMEDGLRVTSDVTEEGVIVFEFRELMQHAAPEPGAAIPAPETPRLEA